MQLRVWIVLIAAAGFLPAQTPKAAAPIDLTGYWVSQIVDEWRFRVSPQKGDISYLPLNAEARRVALEWDPDKDAASGNQCKAYGAVGVMQRPGRLHITWPDDSTLRIDFDAGTQTRLLNFDAARPKGAAALLQGDSAAQWQVARGALLDLGGLGYVPGADAAKRQARNVSLKVVTTNMSPGYLRKNGVPYSGSAVLTEYFNRLTGANNEAYLAVTAMLEDPVYLTQPFVRTYQFKQEADAAKWSPTACEPK